MARIVQAAREHADPMNDPVPDLSSAPISVITPDASENCVGRALLLADLLSSETETRVVGVHRRPELWAPAASWDVPVHSRPMRHAGQYVTLSRWLKREVAGSRVIVSKARPTSLVLALCAGVSPDSLVLDIDDWEVGFWPGSATPRRRRIARTARYVRDVFDPTNLNGYFAELTLDRVARYFSHKLVSNRWLQERHGGTLLPHVRDTDWLDPARVDPGEVRREHAMLDRTWVGFIGTARSHKGVEDMVEALATLTDHDAPGLYFAGADERDPYVRGLIAEARQRLGSDRLRVIGQFGFQELPLWVGVADIVCVPSRNERAAAGQIPAKLFDAMAMAKPVVAARVNDIGEALEGVGVVFEPGDVGALARAIGELSRDPALRSDLGRRARLRAIERYSYRAARPILRQALARVAPQPALQPRGRRLDSRGFR